MFDKILLATDGSPHAIYAAQTAAEIAEKFGSRVTMVSVFSPPPIIPSLTTPTLVIEPGLINEIHESVLTRTGKVLAEKSIRFDSRAELGNPADVIVQIAEEGAYDLIVLGSRGLGDFRRFLLGSVSDRVAHHAHCPVLIAKLEDNR